VELFPLQCALQCGTITVTSLWRKCGPRYFKTNQDTCHTGLNADFHSLLSYTSRIVHPCGYEFFPFLKFAHECGDRGAPSVYVPHLVSLLKMFEYIYHIGKQCALGERSSKSSLFLACIKDFFFELLDGNFHLKILHYHSTFHTTYPKGWIGAPKS
jgi:hypothetical protein